MGVFAFFPRHAGFRLLLVVSVTVSAERKAGFSTTTPYPPVLEAQASVSTPKLMEPDVPSASCTPTLTQGRLDGVAKLLSGFRNWDKGGMGILS